MAQSWFRFLHVLGNPVDLCRPKVIGQTPKFLSTIMTYEQPIDPAHHPCLRSLPKIFLKAMKGISVMVDAFLGEYSNLNSLYVNPGTLFVEVLHKL